jgi:hypothetical protein
MGKHMTDVEWQPLPPLWPELAVWTDVGELMPLVFTQVGMPTWEVSRRAKAGSSRDDLIANGTADTFEAAKAAALFEARARSTEWGTLTQNLCSGNHLRRRGRCSLMKSIAARCGSRPERSRELQPY